MKSTLLVTIIGILFSSCDNFARKNQTHNRIDSSNISISTILKENELQVVYKSKEVKVFADDSSIQNKINYASIKFEPYIYFENFKTKEVYKGIKAKINYKSNDLGSEFKTLLGTEYLNGKSNFAGHYCFISWDCGAPCNMSALIDLIDGKIYNGINAPLGYNFRKDSRMLIVNPPDSAGFYDDCEYCHPEIWIWNEQLKKFKEIQPKK